MNDELLKFIKFVYENWDNLNRITSDNWKKIRDLFSKGDKSLGFIRRKASFLNYLELSKKGFIKKYSKYIIPTEYRGYLLESIVISNLYKKGSIQEGDQKRKKFGEISHSALRIYNLYNTGILSTVFTTIDELIEGGKNEQEITGEASRILDDLIKDESIIYVNLLDNEEEIYYRVKQQLNIKDYCLIYGSGDNSKKIKFVFDKVMDDEEMDEYEIRQNKQRIGRVLHFNLLIIKKTKIIYG